VKTSGTVTEEARKRLGDKESSVEPEINLKTVHRECSAMCAGRPLRAYEPAGGSPPGLRNGAGASGRAPASPWRARSASRRSRSASRISCLVANRPLVDRFDRRAVKGDALVVVKHGPTVGR
jgi:hypothetical protein